MSGEAQQRALILDEYKVWKKNTPFLYDLVMTHALEWPSLTCQWLPDKIVAADDSEVSKQRLILGTHTADGEQNYLMIAEAKLPLPDCQVDARQYHDMQGGTGGFGFGKQGVGQVEITMRINHPGEVNRARYMPQNKFVIATKTIDGDVLVFDTTKHPSKPVDDKIHADIRCTGHTKEGYGVAWNPRRAGHLLSGAYDSLVCLWDIKGQAYNAGALEPKSTFKGHTGVVGDVAWHHHDENLFGSCGDDKLFLVWDKRDASKPSNKVEEAHGAEINCLSFNPNNEFLVATGGADKVVALWDMRNMNKPLHRFEGHTDEILQLSWAPFTESIFASSSADRRVHIWDLARIGREQTEEEQQDGPPELMYVHGGHTMSVSDFSWNSNEGDEWVIASVAEDNVLQIWQMALNLFDDDADAEDTDNNNTTAAAGAAAGAPASDGSGGASAASSSGGGSSAANVADGLLE